MYCKNCGFKIKEGNRYCSNCGTDNFGSNYNNEISKDDKASVGMIILCLLFPIVGFVLYFALKNESLKKAKTYGKVSLISFCVSLFISLICFVLAFFVFLVAAFEHNDIWYDETFQEEVESELYDDDISYFAYEVDMYAKLASGQYYKDLYLDSSIKQKCYNIDELYENVYYDGSVEVRLVDGKEEIIIWLTDYEYYIEGINYDAFELKDIKIGKKVERSCATGGANNSL